MSKTTTTVEESSLHDGLLDALPGDAAHRAQGVRHAHVADEASRLSLGMIGRG